MRISSFYENPSEFFLFVRISFLWPSMWIYFLSLYGKKGAHEYQHLKPVFYHQNMRMICSKFMFFALNSSYCVSNYFLLNKVSLNSLNSVGICTLLVVLVSLPSIFFIEYILTLIQQNRYLFFFLGRLSFYQ